MRIYVVRHGETRSNVEGRLQGQSNDELNENGVRLAAVTGHRQIRVVTNVRSFNPDSLQGFEEVCIAWNHHRLVVHEDFHLRACFGREFRHIVVVTHIITRKFQDDLFLEYAVLRVRGS